MNHLINLARYLPVNEAVQTVSISPVYLHSNDRPQPLALRITAPAMGTNLPVILFSHGDGPSLYIPSKDGYGPLVNFYAEHGFVVIQPTHANSKVAGYSHDMLGAPLFWRTRVEEMKLILDQLEEMEADLPLLKGRLDKESIAVVGHSMGGQTAAMLLGAHLTDSKRKEDADVSTYEPRIKAGVLLAAPGNGGDSLSKFAREHFTELNPDYTYLITPTLSVVGSADVNPFMTVRGAGWYTDAFHHAPGIQQMLTLHGAKHCLGGISGYDAKETGDDEKPDTLAAVQRLTWAYLTSSLNPANKAWQKAQEALNHRASALGKIDSK